MSTATRQARRPDAAPNDQAPGPQGVALLGNVPEARRKGHLQFYLDGWRNYGNIVRFQMGPLVMHLLADADSVHHVLVKNRDNYPKGQGYNKLRLALGQGVFTSEGELWQRQRKLLQPPFTPRGVQQFGVDITTAAEAMLARWAKVAETGQPLNIHQEMMELAMNIIGRAMFGIDLSASQVGEQTNSATQAFAFVLEFVGARSISLLDMPLFVPTASNRRFQEAMRTLDQFMGSMVAEHRQQEAQSPDATGASSDLLSFFLAARDESTGAPMSDHQLRDEILTIFFAGHETTAQALTWIWSLLSRHPQVERKLHAELQEVLGGRPPTAADLPQLPYCRMIVDETLRIYPPVWGYVRDARAEDVIGGYRIPAGSMIMLSPYVTHRHPAYWDNPEGFDPERFAPEQEATRPKYAYFPFGGGPRVCLGDKFALLEAQLVLATVAQRCRLQLLPGHRSEPEAVSTLRPAGGMPMTVHRRDGR